MFKGFCPAYHAWDLSSICQARIACLNFFDSFSTAIRTSLPNATPLVHFSDFYNLCVDLFCASSGWTTSRSSLSANYNKACKLLLYWNSCHKYFSSCQKFRELARLGRTCGCPRRIWVFIQTYKRPSFDWSLVLSLPAYLHAYELWPGLR